MSSALKNAKIAATRFSILLLAVVQCHCHSCWRGVTVQTLHGAVTDIVAKRENRCKVYSFWNVYQPDTYGFRAEAGQHKQCLSSKSVVSFVKAGDGKQ